MKKTFITALIFLIGFILNQNNAFARPIRGEYVVPVSEENKNLEPFATYTVKYKADNYDANPNTLNFPLPATLVGEQKIITMNKIADTDNQWTGDNIETATCQTTTGELACTIKFKNLNIDPVKVENQVNQSYSAAEAPMRSKVALLFGDSPIGIIKYKLRGHGQDDGGDGHP